MFCRKQSRRPPCGTDQITDNLVPAVPPLPTSPLASPQAIEARSLAVAGPVLVVAPHPDDETLGCGGAVALLRARGEAVRVLVVSDGTQSHPHSQKYPAPALRQLREGETQAAMQRLGVSAEQIAFLRLPDGGVPHLQSPTPELSQALAACRIALTAHPPSTIFLPYRYDPHPDHRATWQLIQAVAITLPCPPRLVEYPIWDWDPAQRGELPAGYRLWRLDISSTVHLKQQAIACYRSQIEDLIDDDPSGFRLSPDLLTHFSQPWEIYLEPCP